MTFCLKNFVFFIHYSNLFKYLYDRFVIVCLFICFFVFFSVIICRLVVNRVYIDMSTQTRNVGGTRHQKKANTGGGSGGGDVTNAHSHKKIDIKSDKEKSHPTVYSRFIQYRRIRIIFTIMHFSNESSLQRNNYV